MPLTGQALDEAVEQLKSRHIRDTGARQGFESTGVFKHPAVRSMLERMARQEHRALESLKIMDAQRTAWQGQRGQMAYQQGRTMSTPASTQPASNQPQASKEVLQAQYDDLFLEWHEAKQAGNGAKADVLNRKLSQLAPKVFGG